MTISRLLALFTLLLFPNIGIAQVVNGTADRLGTTGIWSPAVTASGTAGTPAYTIGVGSYVKIGSMVYVQFNLVLSGWTGSPVGNISITGLPFTSTANANDDGGCIVTQYIVTGLASLNYGVSGVIAPNSSSATILSEGNTGTANVTAAQAGTTPTLVGFCNYHI